MNDEEWKKHRDRAIAGAFQTGRPIFADSDGAIHFADGDREAVPDAIGVTPEPLPQARTPYTRGMRASRAAFVASIFAVVMNVSVGFWRPLHFLYAAVMLSSALVWRHVHRLQRKLYGIRR